MKKTRLIGITGWIARIYGTLVLAIPLIALFRALSPGGFFTHDWRNYVLYTGLIVGLFLAYKWPLAGGIITTLGIFISGFIHPIIIPAGLLYILYGVLKKRNAPMQHPTG